MSISRRSSKSQNMLHRGAKIFPLPLAQPLSSDRLLHTGPFLPVNQCKVSPDEECSRSIVDLLVLVLNLVDSATFRSHMMLVGLTKGLPSHPLHRICAINVAKRARWIPPLKLGRAFDPPTPLSQHPPNAFEDARALHIERHDLGDDVLRIAQGVFLGLVGVLHRKIETGPIDARHIDRP